MIHRKQGKVGHGRLGLHGPTAKEACFGGGIAFSPLIPSTAIKNIELFYDQPAQFSPDAKGRVPTIPSNILCYTRRSFPCNIFGIPTVWVYLVHVHTPPGAPPYRTPGALHSFPTPSKRPHSLWSRDTSENHSLWIYGLPIAAHDSVL